MKIIYFITALSGVCAFLVFGGSEVKAQDRIFPGFEEAASLDELPQGNAANEDEAEPQSLPLDNAIASVLNGLSATLNKWEKNHPASYLATVCLAAGLVLGLGVALTANFTTSPHARWTEVRRKSLLIATGIGVGLAVFLVTLHFSVPAHAKVTYLLMALVFCSIASGVGCGLGLLILRKLRILKAKKMGVQIDNERMWIR
jgi:hypothetical protein